MDVYEIRVSKTNFDDRGFGCGCLSFLFAIWVIISVFSFIFKTILEFLNNYPKYTSLNIYLFKELAEFYYFTIIFPIKKIIVIFSYFINNKITVYPNINLILGILSFIIVLLSTLVIFEIVVYKIIVFKRKALSQNPPSIKEIVKISIISLIYFELIPLLCYISLFFIILIVSLIILIFSLLFKWLFQKEYLSFITRDACYLKNSNN